MVFNLDVEYHIKSCKNCQKQGDLKLKMNSMKKVRVDLCGLPGVDGCCYLIVCIDYFSKWSEAKPITDKTASVIAQLLYKIMCRHGSFAVQIDDQGREIVKKVSDELNLLTDVQQRVSYKCLSRKSTH